MVKVSIRKLQGMPGIHVMQWSVTMDGQDKPGGWEREGKRGERFITKVERLLYKRVSSCLLKLSVNLTERQEPSMI